MNGLLAPVVAAGAEAALLAAGAEAFATGFCTLCATEAGAAGSAVTATGEEAWLVRTGNATFSTGTAAGVSTVATEATWGQERGGMRNECPTATWRAGDDVASLTCRQRQQVQPWRWHSENGQTEK